jgi:hypothetical protein
MVARYLAADGGARELVVIAGAEGSVLVVDRDVATLCDRRLVAHLGADEPPENVELVSRLYLADMAGGEERRCRLLLAGDLTSAPLDGDLTSPPPGERGCPVEASAVTLRCDGRLYRLGRAPRSDSRAGELRWCGTAADDGPWMAVSLREVVGRFESYEPMRSLTGSALAREERVARRMATSTLRGELRRMQCSPVVLNRGLREAVVRAVEDRGLSMSEIAIRCGKVKRDRRGRCSGETSWLARRVGLLPQAGEREAVRWVHSDVLALIARRGLGISPREVELG